MKQKFFIATLFFLGYSFNGYSCINEYRTKLDGTVSMTEDIMDPPYPRFNIDNKEELLAELHEADSIYRSTKRIEDYSDYAAKLIYLGRYDEAKHALFTIEKRKPDLYATASNLGTLYELTGVNDSALVWIKKALQLNPDSHLGSEWIHVRILEAKIAAKGNPHYFKTHSILSFDFGEDETPRFDTSKTNLEEVSLQLYHQLCERISFVKPEDPVIAQLLFDLGNMHAITKDVHLALDDYELAKQYGYSSGVLHKRERHFTALKQKADKKNNRAVAADVKTSVGNMTGYLVAAGIVAVLLVLFIVMLTRKERVR